MSSVIHQTNGGTVKRTTLNGQKIITEALTGKKMKDNTTNGTKKVKEAMELVQMDGRNMDKTTRVNSLIAERPVPKRMISIGRDITAQMVATRSGTCAIASKGSVDNINRQDVPTAPTTMRKDSVTAIGMDAQPIRIRDMR